MPKKLMKVIWKVLSPGSSTSSSPSSNPPASPPSPQGRGAGGEGLSFSLPVQCPETQPWSANPSTYARWGFPCHNGRDHGCPLYHPVHPAGEGIIDRIGFEAGGYGLYLRIDHGTFWTYYCHLSENSVRYPIGAPVYSHLIIALVGSTGFSSGPHLHWGARHKSYPSSDPCQSQPTHFCGWLWYHDHVHNIYFPSEGKLAQ